MIQLNALRCWIFDMDGTLTVPAHDFEAIRKDMGLASNEPILEAIERMPASEAKAAAEHLYELEMDVAREAVAGEGVDALLSELKRRKMTVGIVTRNGFDIARETLTACDLLKYFDSQFIMGREQAAPKPKPDGILQLLASWQSRPEEAVMIGDYYYDLAAGKAAGTATVFLDIRGDGAWSDYADVTVKRLGDLLEFLQ